MVVCLLKISVRMISWLTLSSFMKIFNFKMDKIAWKIPTPQNVHINKIIIISIFKLNLLMKLCKNDVLFINVIVIKFHKKKYILRCIIKIQFSFLKKGFFFLYIYKKNWSKLVTKFYYQNKWILLLI